MRNEALGSRISSVRRKHGLSLTEMASGLASRSYLSMIEHGQRRPAPEILLGIARRLDMTVKDLLKGVDATPLLPGLLRYGYHLNVQERWSDAAEISDTVLAHAGHGSPARTEAALRLGYTLTMTSQYDLAERRLREGLRDANALGDPELRAAARNYWGLYFLLRNRLNEAKEAFEEAWRMIQGLRLRDRTLPGAVLMNLGQVEWDFRRPLAALKYYRESLAVFRRANDYIRQGKVLRLIGAAYDDAGLHHLAIDPLRQAAEAFAHDGNERHLARVVRSLGIVLKRQGDLAAARQNLTRALHLVERLADDRGLASTLPELAHVALLEEQWDEALHYAARAASAATKVESPENVALANMVKAAVLAHKDQSLKAVGWFRTAIDGFQSANMGPELREAWSRLGRLYMEMGDMERASDALARAVALRDAVPEPVAVN